MIVDIKLLHTGSIILYKLLPCQCPVNPDKLWRGRIVSLSPDTALVESLEPKYYALTEIVLFNQIAEIEGRGEGV